MASSNKVDMALEDIIALNNKRGRGGGRGRGGRGAVRGRGRGGVGRGGRGRSQTPIGRGNNVRGLRRGRGTLRGRRGNQAISGRGNFKNRQQQVNQQTRRAGRNEVFDTRRNLPQQQANQQTRGTFRGRRGKLVQPTGLQRGRANTAATGRGRGRGTSALRGRKFVGRGAGSLPTNTATRGIRGRRGRAQTLATASVNRAKKLLSGAGNNGGSSVTRGRGIAARRPRSGRNQRGRGRSLTTSSNDRLQVSFASPIATEPEGIDLAFNFGASHHTQQSLDNRFTPVGNRKAASSNRMVFPNERSVEYNT